MSKQFLNLAKSSLQIGKEVPNEFKPRPLRGYVLSQASALMTTSALGIAVRNWELSFILLSWPFIAHESGKSDFQEKTAKKSAPD